MAAVRLAGGTGRDRTAARVLAQRLRDEYGITVAVTVLDGGVWVRVSAQIYNEIGDYQRLAAIGRGLSR